MTILEKIDNVIFAIFDFETMNVANNIINIFSEIIDTNLIDTKVPFLLNQINSLMANCLNAMQNKDYLLLADYLEYQLKPMLRR